jgi:monofunctional biosynthetic peptidoglycan transglycosylase
MKCTIGKTVFQVMVIFSLSIFFLGANEMKMTGKQRILLDFEKAEDSRGVSASSLQVTKTGTAVFSGTVSLENNGGFASTNMKPSQFDLSDCDGIRFRIKGDGKKYKISLKNDDSFNGFSYRFEFSTKNDEWLTLDVPFASFIPMFMGQTTSAPPVDRSSIKTFGFLIADKQAGPFRLEIDWIGAYGKKGKP